MLIRYKAEPDPTGSRDNKNDSRLFMSALVPITSLAERSTPKDSQLDDLQDDMPGLEDHALSLEPLNPWARLTQHVRLYGKEDVPPDMLNEV